MCVGFYKLVVLLLMKMMFSFLSIAFGAKFFSSFFTSASFSRFVFVFVLVVLFDDDVLFYFLLWFVEFLIFLF